MKRNKHFSIIQGRYFLFILLILFPCSCKKDQETQYGPGLGSLEVVVAKREKRTSEVPDYEYCFDYSSMIYLFRDTLPCRFGEDDGFIDLNPFGISKKIYYKAHSENGFFSIPEILAGEYYLLLKLSYSSRHDPKNVFSEKFIEIEEGETLQICKYFASLAKFSNQIEPWDYVFYETDSIPNNCNR